MQIKKVTCCVSTIMAMSLVGCGIDSSNQVDNTQAGTVEVVPETAGHLVKDEKVVDTSNSSIQKFNSTPKTRSVARRLPWLNTSEVLVKVVDTNGKPIKNARVLVASNQAQTNKLGIVTFQNITAYNIHNVSINARKYISQVVRLNPTFGDNSRVLEITLKEKASSNIVANIDDYSKDSDIDPSDNTGSLVMCTMHYEPVCAKQRSNGRIVYRTYSNSCLLGNSKDPIIKSVDGACPAAIEEIDTIHDNPVMCPMHYEPVCAKQKSNGRIVYRTYGNSCLLGNSNDPVIKSVEGSCPAGLEEKESSSTDTSISYHQGSFVTRYGIPAKGEANISITPWDVSSKQDMKSFLAKGDADYNGSSLVKLQSYGAVNVEVKQRGRNLKLKEGKLVTINTPLVLNNYYDGKLIREGDSIPLWHFSKKLGRWVKDGQGLVSSQNGRLSLTAKVSKLGAWSWGTVAINNRPTFVKCQLSNKVSVPCSLDITLGSANNGFFNGHSAEVSLGGSSVNNLDVKHNSIQYTARYFDKKENLLYVGTESSGSVITLNKVEPLKPLKPTSGIDISCVLPNGSTVACSGDMRVKFTDTVNNSIVIDIEKYSFKTDGVLPYNFSKNYGDGKLITAFEINAKTKDRRYFIDETVSDINGITQSVKLKLKDTLVNNNPSSMSIGCKKFDYGLVSHDSGLVSHDCKGIAEITYRDESSNELITTIEPFSATSTKNAKLNFKMPANTIYSVKLSTDASSSEYKYVETFDVIKGIPSEVTLGGLIPIYDDPILFVPII